MFSQLIYTRCGEGIDLLKDARAITNSGFKVYSCSPKVMENGYVDLPFLFSTAQIKVPFAIPSLMDDAYIYTVPSFGEKYLMSSHPIDPEENTTGTYSHRSGNFINQIYIGNFESIYPYETFGDDNVWKAKLKGEAYYYEKKPTALCETDDLGKSLGNICFDDIAGFVSAGRKQALISAVSFIISQFSLSPEKRKFLVISDENSRNIELWIAAIESAFSPRMASGLSFATRFDKFSNSNRYAVNAEGRYQTQINLQNPNQKICVRAMIVGVDARDRINASAVKNMAGLPFVVLDGKNNALSVNVDTSESYYNVITSFDEKHDYFCREFLQMIDISEPTADIFSLYNAYKSLERYERDASIDSLISGLGILNKYKLFKSKYLTSLCSFIMNNISEHLKENAVASFIAINWMNKVAEITGEQIPVDSLTDILCNTYADAVYTDPMGERTVELQNEVDRSTFRKSISEYFTGEACVSKYSGEMNKYDSEQWMSVSKAFTDSLRCLSNSEMPKTAKTVLSMCLNALFKTNDELSAESVAKMFAGVSQSMTVGMMMEQAKNSKSDEYTRFIFKTVTMAVPELTASESKTLLLYSKLTSLGMAKQFPTILATVVSTRYDQLKDIERYFDWICMNPEFAKLDFSPVEKAIDRKINIVDPMAATLSIKLQNRKKDDVICKNSAHVMAFSILDDKRFISSMVPTFQKLVLQDFPSIENEVYSIKFLNKLFSGKAPDSIYPIVLNAATRSPYYTAKLVDRTIQCVGTRQSLFVIQMFQIAAKSNSRNLYDSIVSTCGNAKQFKKTMCSIKQLLNTKETAAYFAKIEKDAAVIYGKNKQPSFFGRFFNGRND